MLIDNVIGLMFSFGIVLDCGFVVACCLFLSLCGVDGVLLTVCLFGFLFWIVFSFGACGDSRFGVILVL